MFKWIGNNIFNLISRFRDDVYLDSVSSGTIVSGGNLGLDSNNKIVKATEATGDLTSIVAGTGLSGTSLTGPIPTLNLALTELSTVTPTSGDFLATLDGNTPTHQNTTTDSLATLFAGTGLTASSAVISVDASQAQITRVGTISAGEWRASAISTAYLNGQSGTNTGDETLASINALDITEVGTISSGVWQGTTIKTAYIGDDQITEDKLANTLLAEIDANTAKVTNSDQSKADINALDITEVGTIDSGVWQGTAITHAYIGNDAIEGDNIADDAVDSEHYTDGSIDTAHIADDQVTFAKAQGVTPNVFNNKIKLLPSDFVANDDGNNQKFGIGYVDDAGATTYGMRAANSLTELYAFVSIPQGMSATHVNIFGRSNIAVVVYEAQVNATSMTSKGTGNCNTAIDMSGAPVASTEHNFLAIKITIATFSGGSADRIFGGHVTIAAS